LTKKVKEAKSNKVHVVSEAFLDEFAVDKIAANDSVNLESLIEKYSICDWGSDLKTRMDLCVKSHEQKALDKEQKYSLKSATGDGSGKIKMKMKDGAVVDPDSGLEDDSHVLIESDTKEPYSCVLGLVDIVRGSNSFYKIQLIESDDLKKYHVFRSWGRVGTTIGGNKLDKYATKTIAISTFQSVYFEKTGSHWAYRKSAPKIANKFYPLEIEFGGDDVLYLYSYFIKILR
jgi:poly [ADP-ribose] polymerase